MNWLLMIVVLVLALYTINGYRKGLLRILYSMVSWVVMLVFVTWATPYISTFIAENTSLYDRIAAYSEMQIREKADERLAEQTQNAAEQANGMEGVLPESVLNSISEKTAEAAGNILETEGIYAQAAEGMAGFVLNGISFFVSLAIAMFVLHFVAKLLGIVSKIPVIRGINRYLGIAAGALYGMFIVWIGFYLIAVCSAGEIAAALISYIYESPFLTYIYENNPIVTLVLMYL